MALIKCPDCGTQISDSAPSCPKCGRPAGAPIKGAQWWQNPPLWRFLAVVVLAFIILRACGIAFNDSESDGSSYEPTSEAITAAAQHPMPAPSSAPAPTRSNMPKVIFNATPAQLYWLYAKNEVRADDKFDGKIIQVTAPVQSIDKDFTNSVVLHFGTGVPYEDFSAELKDSQKSAAAALNIGQSVTVQCPKISRIMDSPYARDCVLVKKAAQTPSS